MSFYAPYDFYDLIDLVNQRNAHALEQQQRQRRQSRTPGLFGGVGAPQRRGSNGRSGNYGYGVGPQRRVAQHPNYFSRAQGYPVQPGFIYKQPSYSYYDDEDEDDNNEEVYTLNDVLNLINRHQSQHPETYTQLVNPSRPTGQQDKISAVQKQAQQLAEDVAREEAAEEAANDELQRQQQKQADVVPESRQFDLTDLIRQALLAGDVEEEKNEEEVETDEKSTATSPSTSTTGSFVKSEGKKPELQRKNSFKKPTKVSSFHLSCPSPVHDPLQVSQPQLDSNLPFSPHVDIYDKPDLYKVVLALPGASKSSFEVDFHPSNHELFIRGSTSNKDKLVSKDKADESEDLQYLKVSEINFGSFERSIKFPILPKVKDEEIKAKYFNGLLEVLIPKLPKNQEDVKPKKRVTVEEVEDEELKFEDGLNKL